MIICCRVILKIIILELALTAALYFCTLRVKIISGDTDNILTICTSLSYDVFKLVRDRSPSPRSLFYLFWWRVSIHPIVVCGDECIGWVSPCTGVCCLIWRWCPALIENERDLSGVLLCTRRPPVFLVHRFPLQHGFL